MEFLIHDVADVLQGRVLVLHFVRKLMAEPGEINLAQVHGESLGMILTGLLGAYGLVDDFVQFLEHLGDIGRVALLFQLFIDGLEVIVPVGIGEGTRLHQQGLEPYEHLPCHDFEAPLGLIRCVERVHGVAQGLDAVEALGRDQPHRAEA